MNEEDEKSEALYRNHILRVCTALGGKDNGVYEPGDEAIGTFF